MDEKRQRTMANRPNPRRVLMITNSELGEANVFLATCQELVKADVDIELHLASFADLESVVNRASDDIRRLNPRAKPIVFHRIRGLPLSKTFVQVVARNRGPSTEMCFESWTQPLSFSTSLRAIKDTVPFFIPYDGPQLVEMTRSISEIIKDVAVGVVVVDTLHTAGLTASQHLGVKLVCLSPNNIKIFAGSDQPWMANLWKWPALFSGYPYPVPLHLIPLNIMLILYAVFLWFRYDERRKLTDYLRAQTGAQLFTPFDLIWKRDEKLKILVSTHPELDYVPMVCPPRVHPCGPIVHPARAIADAAPQLLAWLARGPTISFNMGSLFALTRHQARETAEALSSVLKKLDSQQQQTGGQRFQILWKLMTREPAGEENGWPVVQDILSRYIKDDERVKIVSWVEAEPISILRSGHVACAVHHGGANSYNEAVVAGVPQVVLPQWTDCYDYARIVELHGIGIQGNKAAQPVWTVRELSAALMAVLDGGEAGKAMAVKAKQLARLCEERGSGAAEAARCLLEEMPRYNDDDDVVEAEKMTVEEKA